MTSRCCFTNCRMYFQVTSRPDHSPPREGTRRPGGVMALAGLSQSRRPTEAQLDVLNADMVLGNKAVFGTVNAGCRHYEQAAYALAHADRAWLARLITRRLAPERWTDALDKGPFDIKVVIEMTAGD